MIMTNKIVAVALITALIGASLGAAVMHSRDTARVADASTTVPDNSTALNNTREARYTTAADMRILPNSIRRKDNPLTRLVFLMGSRHVVKAATSARPVLELSIATLRYTGLTLVLVACTMITAGPEAGVSGASTAIS